MEIKSYKKKNGETSYGFIVYVGKENGKSKYARKKGFATKAKARAALLQLQEDIENGEQSRKEITVEEIAKNGSKITLKLSKKVPTSRLLGISRITSIQFLAIGK